ncbi:Hypothetical protein PHPALM_20497 [Phytophthora palmivora]|uniref:Tyr recombinase domain-containing protein n=1 Tax=Phytophthora palmivora TaxID=4796 RepID=A0A2P4XER0_9STRA|nr:Hypothetical protein PHPALM_20497 [Phytophthora palmivora]
MLPKNHKPALESLNALKLSIRQGQDDGTYLVVDLDVATRWGDIRFSPFGCVPEKDADPRIEARLIHDLSSPPLHSTNALSNQGELPDVQFCVIHIIVTSIETLHRQYPDLTIKMLKGDVRSAFRHIMLGSQISRWVAGSIRENNVTIINLALPFGWTGSPGYYGVVGRAISHLVERESPSTMNPSCAGDEVCFGFEYVDDHVQIEVDRENRLELAETTLRLAMMALLGPRAINETKFSLWTTQLVVLGLEWDTIARTVSMPVEKISKARLRICKLLQSGNATRHQISKLLGSLRHVCSSVRSAKPFYQRIMSQWRTLPLHGRTLLSNGNYFLLRRSEYLAIDGKRHRYCLQVHDLQVVDANERPTLDIKFEISVQIRLRGSKNDQYVEEAIRSLGKATEPPLCPVFAAILLLQHDQYIGLTHDDPVCLLTKNHMVSAKLMTKLLRLLAHHTDQSTAAFSTHSLRVGGATALMEGGVESLSVQQHGRWKSDAFKRYTRYTKTTGRKLTSKMFKGGITY